MKYGYIHTILKYFLDLFNIMWIILCFFYVNALYMGYFRCYVLIDTAFYAINITMPARLKYICAVGLC